MVDTTFGVVHSETNEWKLVIWLNSIDKRTAFVLVWNGIFGTGHIVFRRSHISHMRIDRIRRLPAYKLSQAIQQTHRVGSFVLAYLDIGYSDSHLHRSLSRSFGRTQSSQLKPPSIVWPYSQFTWWLHLRWYVHAYPIPPQ
ncbi:hypothetical protein B0H10DRAFT_2116486 [Mycena sp. CBHHK59/15]|nr:hypothetical protein B0H10DRAFT_2116486 [Mycena sp. CBHHK59/15]